MVRGWFGVLAGLSVASAWVLTGGSLWAALGVYVLAGNLGMAMSAVGRLLASSARIAASRMRRTAELPRWVGASARLGRAGAVVGLAGLLTTWVSHPALAEGFRRVGVPAAGSTDRIRVQIGVEVAPTLATAVARSPGRVVPEVRSAPAPRVEGAAARAAGVEWFWTGVSPLLAASRPERLEDALVVLAGAPAGEITTPGLEGLEDMARLYGPDILRETAGTRVSPALVLAVMAVESAGRADAVSHAGAAGLMQLMPATAARFGVEDRLRPSESIRGGVAYLDWLLERFDGDPILALAGYNAGEGSVENNGGVPPYDETRAYVPKVLAAWTVARSLCQSPPELASDACEFSPDTL